MKNYNKFQIPVVRFDGSRFQLHFPPDLSGSGSTDWFHFWSVRRTSSLPILSPWKSANPTIIWFTHFYRKSIRIVKWKILRLNEKTSIFGRLTEDYKLKKETKEYEMGLHEFNGSGLQFGAV